MMRIRLIRKLSECLDGVDLSQHRVGEVLDLPESDARLLIAEGWGSSEARPLVLELDRSVRTIPLFSRAEAVDAPLRVLRTLERLRGRRHESERQREEQEHRRAEDRILDELRDACAKTI